MIGTTLAHYEILEKLGEGGMGVVYRARDQHLDRLVAIKVLPENKVGDDDRLRRFAQEARTASALNHPNIITIHDIAREGGTQYIVMEYVRGRTLDHLIPHKGMRLGEVLKIGIQVAEAVAAAAEAGVVHRDLKPGNIMVSESGLVKVVDFGLAKLASRTEALSEQSSTLAMSGETAHTQDGAILGTLSYMSPEQAEGKPADGRSDIFSFGAVLYEMVTGQQAFGGATKMSKLSAVIREEPKLPSTMAAGTPRDLEKIITRCLRKDPERRFQHMSDVRVALVELKEESESGTLTSPVAPRKRTGAKWIFSAAGMVMLISGASVVWIRERPALPAAEVESRMVPFISSGSANNPTFSPDGNQIAFSWNGDAPGQNHIYVKMIGTESPLRLTTGDLPDIAPAWAPDGKSIAYLRVVSPGQWAVLRVPPLGGQERRLGEIRSPLPHLSWTGDSKWLAISDRGNDKHTRIVLLSAETAEKRLLTAGGSADEVMPEISPDNRWLAFLHFGETTDGLFVLALDSELRPVGQPRELNVPTGLKRGLAWTADSKDIVYQQSRTAPMGVLMRVPAAGDAPARRVPFIDGNAGYPAIRGNRLAFTQSISDSNIWQFDLSGPGGRATGLRPVVKSTRLDLIHPGGISPDGRRIAFESNRSGPYGIWTANADGSNPTFLLGAEYVVGSPAWSPDGRSIAFDTRKDGNVEIYVIPADGGGVRRLTNDPSDDMVPCWSRGGKWIYFVSNRTGRFEIFKMPVGGGDAVQFTREGGWGPQESVDGKFLFYSRNRASNTPLVKMPVEGGAETVVLESSNDREWRVVKEGIWHFWSSRQSDAGTLRFLNFSSGKVSDVADVPNRRNTRINNGIDVSLDGRTLLFTRVDHIGTELMLVENFR